MLHHLLEKYIPSASYVAYLKEHDFSFTDFETACILHQCDLPPMEEIEAYRELLRETKDEKLRLQLEEEIAWNLHVFDTFKAGGAHIAYITSSIDSDDDGMLGICANYETAYELGIRSGEAFEIKKHRLMTEYPREPVIKKHYFNPYMSDSDDWRDSVETYREEDFFWGIGTLLFRKDGVLTHMYSSEAEEGEDDAAIMERYYARDRFTNAFVAYPMPFARGDAVRWTGQGGENDEMPGIVETSPEEWNDFLKRVKNGLYVDQSDASLTVEWIQNSGRFSHSHVPPIFLEKYEPEKDAPYRALLESAAALLRGQESLDWFTGCLEEYRRRETREG